jgi:hypothetical protein
MMAEQISIAELLSTGITPSTDEAVAAARALMRDRSSATPEVSEVALLLRRLLPIGTAGVPGALHYAIARALREVDAPPFDSVEDFSNALARFEHGDSARSWRGLPERAQGGATLTAARPPGTWKRPVAAWVTAAATLIFSGEAVHRWLAAPTTTAAREALPHDVVLEAPAGAAQVVPGPQPVSKRIARTAQRAPVPAMLRRASRSKPSHGERGLFRRLHLQWLSKAFTRRT